MPTDRSEVEDWRGYVWVFSSLEGSSTCTDPRGRAFLQELLKGFKGVAPGLRLHAAYDGVECPSRSALLIRDA